MRVQVPGVALFGGDARYCRGQTLGVHGFPCTRHGGRGRVRALLQAIRAHAFDVVLVLVRWVGHSEHEAVRSACAAAGVRCVPVTGGWSAARRRLAELGISLPSENS